MPVIVSCPECEKKLRVPDNLIGKKVKCPGCAGMFTATAEDAPDKEEAAPKKASNKAGVVRDEDVEDKPKRKSVVPPPVKDGYEDEDSHKKRKSSRYDDEDEDDRPRSRRGRDDDDDEDDRPRSRRGRDYDDDDDEDTASRRRRQRDMDDEEEDEDDMPRPSEARSGWRKVRTGITLVLTAIFIQIGWGFLSVCGGFILGAATIGSIGSARTAGQAAGAAAGLGAGIIIMAAVGQLVQLVVYGLEGAGYGMSLGPPARSGSMIKGLALATIALFGASVLGHYGSQIFTWVNFGFGVSGGVNPFAVLGASGIIIGMSLLSGVCWLVHTFTYLFFLRSVCYNVRDQGGYKHVTTYIMCYSILIGLCVLVFLLALLILGAAMSSLFSSTTARGAQRSAATGMAAAYGFMGFSCLAGIAALALFVWFIVLLFQVRGSIDRHLRRI